MSVYANTLVSQNDMKSGRTVEIELVFFEIDYIIQKTTHIILKMTHIMKSFSILYLYVISSTADQSNKEGIRRETKIIVMGRVWFEKKNVDDDGDAAGHIANDELAFSRSSAFDAVSRRGAADVFEPV